MTLLPAYDQNVKGVDLPKYKVPSVCCAPSCSRFSDHAHHVWRRSFLGGDFAWVELPGHLIVGNLVPLCWRHHEDVTGNLGGHRARIIWEEKQRTFFWNWLDEERKTFVSGLSYQPPIHGQPPKGPVTSHAAEPGPAAGDVCPGCRRRLPKPDVQKDALRRRKSWTIQVPADTAEDGALVLDTLLDECARLFGHEDGKPNLRYFTVVQALALVVQHGERMLRDD